ncbi:hypothetical protein HDF19_15970 [Mucilaginibacter sp. E4BP6]|uniref:hypothetical protein n=1 Tax=Mucilaginibacter sp. E4BP6 TaxID=2723089 RepID=UPI0015CA884A|nr:hypothetical protein [Mucilaginibacter sp. E4BP6]NYE66618.1 hypothetical protein [Mucilaginibacter sp. E4BP6]
MIGNFTAEAGVITFEFFTQHTVNLHGFQVYVLHEQKKIRFHMQVKNSSTFYITYPQACPAALLPLEALLSQAIMSYGNSIKGVINEPAADQANNIPETSIVS